MALCEADLYGSVSNVRDAARAKSLAYKDKNKNERGSKGKTQAALQIQRIEVEFLSCIADYNRHQLYLLALGFPNASKLPHMTPEDTYCKPTHHTRKIGDSRCVDGALYHFQLQSNDNALSDNDSPLTADPVAGTIQTRRARPSGIKAKPGKTNKDEMKDGWLWMAGHIFKILGQGRQQDLSKFDEESAYVTTS
ncbi:hypothetical protein BDP27DRAFT_1418135 [Rhodocollybia butyracea]|uniref:Uncharacterized protein n=1 Tax=Rhodocollybia butyracea TaxID=206335 RepID=A0A9P5PZ09_9AGAR|nr:hypothetical protein BDP27DRAFT_1418135 [Rhodocollybia butyracea]